MPGSCAEHGDFLSLLGFCRLFIKAMNPVGEVVIKEIDNRTERPCDGIGHVDILNFVDDAHDDGDICDRDASPLDTEMQ